jgi:hypothetical protein
MNGGRIYERIFFKQNFDAFISYAIVAVISGREVTRNQSFIASKVST